MAKLGTPHGTFVLEWRSEGLPRLRVPNPRSVVLRSRDETFSVRAEISVQNPAFTLECLAEQTAGRGVENLNHVILEVRNQQPLAVWTKREKLNPGPLRDRRAAQFASQHVPLAQGFIAATSRKPLAIRAELQLANPAGMLDWVGDFCARADIPKTRQQVL